MAVHSEGRGLLPLLHLQVGALLYGLGVRRDSGSLRVVGACAIVVLLAVMAVTYLWTLGSSMVAAGVGGAIPVLAALAGSLVAVALVFVKAPGTVFGCRDYDLVAALPVPVHTVVLARTVPLYSFAVALSVLLSVPLYAVYFLAIPASPLAVVAAVVCSVLAPLAPAAVAVLASLALTSIAVRFRHAGAVQLVLSALAVAAVVVGSLALGSASSGADDAAVFAAMGDVTGVLSSLVASAYPPAAWAAAAVREGSVAGLFAFVALSLVFPALVTLALAACYPSVNAVATSGPRRRARSVATSRAVVSPLQALTVKELRRISSMPFYALNDCAGMLLMVVAAVAIAMFGVDALLTSGVIDGVQLDAQAAAALHTQVEAILPWVFGFCGAMSLTAGPSVSLEARANWLMLTAPVGAGVVLGSKLLANLVLGGMAAAISAIALLAGGVAPLLVLQCAVTAIGMLTGFASVALALDAARPSFAWTTPAEVIKRGLPMMVGALGGAFVSLGLGFVSVTASGAIGPAASIAINLATPAICALIGLATLRMVVRRGLPGPGWGE